jgi:hypothetical protein
MANFFMDAKFKSKKKLKKNFFKRKKRKEKDACR